MQAEHTYLSYSGKLTTLEWKKDIWQAIPPKPAALGVGIHWLVLSASFSLNWGGSIFPLCAESCLFSTAQPLLAVQGKGEGTDHIRLCWFILSQVTPMPLVVQTPPFIVFPRRVPALYDFSRGIYMSTCNVWGWKGRTHHTPYLFPTSAILLLPLLPPDIPLPPQPTQTEILRLIMASADKMKKAIKCVQRGTLWSFSNIPLPLILGTVNTLMTQTTWPRGCKAGRAPSLQLSAWPLQTKPKQMWHFHLCWVWGAIDQDPCSCQ